MEHLFNSTGLPGSPSSELRDRTSPTAQQQHQDAPGEARSETDSEVDCDDYEPIGVPDGYPPLDYRPLTLKTWFLLLTAIFFSACMLGIVVLLAIQRVDPRRLHMRPGRNRFVFEYMPVILSSITTLWWRSVVNSYNRLLPYITMASLPISTDGKLKLRHTRMIRDLNTLATFEWNFSILQDLFHDRHWMTLSINLLRIFIGIFLSAFKASLLQFTQEPNGWTLTVSNAAAYVLITVYGALSLSTIAIIVRLSGISTGLKWEVGSVASQLALATDSNIFGPLEGTEYLNESSLRRVLRTWSSSCGVLRLGYWKRKRDGLILHGVRFFTPLQESTALIEPIDFRYSLHIAHKPGNRCRISPYRQAGTLQKIEANVQVQKSLKKLSGLVSTIWHVYLSNAITEKPRFFGPGEEELCSPELAKFVPGWINLSDPALLLMEAIGLVCIVLCTVFLARGKLHEPMRYTPPLATEPDNIFGKFETNMLYAFLPVALFSIFNMVILAADIYYRFVQPFRSMATPQYAHKNVLLDYVSPNSLVTIVTALQNGHFRVAWHSFFVLFSTSTPVVAARVFNNRKLENGGYTISVSPGNFYASYAILIIYCIAFFVARPPAKFRIPRVPLSLIDTLSLCYDSHIRLCPEFVLQHPDHREADLVAQLTLSRVRFQFGMYTGLSGMRHLGFSPTLVVTPIGTQYLPVDCVVSGSDWTHLAGFWLRGRGPRIVPAAEDEAYKKAKWTSGVSCDGCYSCHREDTNRIRRGDWASQKIEKRWSLGV